MNGLKILLMWCIIALLAVNPTVSLELEQASENAWGFFKASDKDSLFKNVGRFAKVTSENSFYVNKMTKFFPEDALAATIKNVDDYEHVTKGTKVVMEQYLGGLNDFQKSLPSSEKLRLIKIIGRYDELIKQKGWVRYNFQDPTYKGIAHSDLYRYGVSTPDEAVSTGFKALGSHEGLLEHVRDMRPSTFISTSAYQKIAAKFASNDFRNGYVFKIDPRALNGINVAESLKPLRDAGKIDDETWYNIVEQEWEISFLGSIDPQDIIGYWKVNFKGEIVGDLIPNKNYLT